MGLRGYLSAVAALTALLAAPLQAQECNIQLPTGCGGGSLSHNGNEHVGGTHGGNMHGQCWICWSEGEGTLEPERCHQCGAIGGSSEGHYALLMDAANQRNVAALASVANRSPHWITLNHARQAIQILSCNSAEVIASIPASPAQLAYLERVVTLAIARRETEIRGANASLD